ncbi:hypothetical protein KCP77_08860 [Salmonella enterica subsp. enterica]|nr:hypothetical protein KCP77_08860 [Salmonella enterica subsp. enterica]
MCACTTCHCIVREGFDSLPESSEEEDDMLDKSVAGAGKSTGAAVPALPTTICYR